MSDEQRGINYEYIRLKSKPAAQLCYSFSPPTPHGDDPILIVFINGLGMPQVGWETAVFEVKQSFGGPAPALLTYDRFGQGKTEDRDPADEGATDPSHAHDCLSAVADLHQLIHQILTERTEIGDVARTRLLMVGNSVGCSIIRLYAQEHRNSLNGAIFLDSTLTDTDFVSIFPDPDADGFNPTKLPAGVTPRNLKMAREKIGALFHPNVGSKEGLSRRNLRELLPKADEPKLQGYDDEPPLVDVLGHDFTAFAQNTYESLQIPAEVINNYMNPYWHHYNQGLAKLTVSEKARGPVQVPHAGHFIQVDNPHFVARRIKEMVEAIRAE